MITDVAKRSFTEWLNGSKANAKLPYPPEKKSASDFSRACRITPNEVGNHRKTSEASFAVELSSAIRK